LGVCGDYLILSTIKTGVCGDYCVECVSVGNDFSPGVCVDEWAFLSRNLRLFACLCNQPKVSMVIRILLDLLSLVNGSWQHDDSIISSPIYAGKQASQLCSLDYIFGGHLIFKSVTRFCLLFKVRRHNFCFYSKLIVW
jgi:hypothetical protein